MARFQALQRLYEQRYDEAKQALGRCLSAIRAVQDRIETLRRERQQRAQGVDLVWHTQFEAYWQFSQQQEHEAQVAVTHLQDQRQEMQHGLLEARRQLKSVELLQERERRELARRERRRAEVELIELISRRSGEQAS
jgi:flagellar export protein FliJ